MKVYTDILSRCIWMALLVMLLLFPVTAINPFQLNSRVDETTPVYADGGTGWSGSWIKEGEPGFPGGPKNMELTQSGNNVTGYNYDNGRKVACMVDPGNPNVTRGNWDASNRMLAEMTLSPDGQTLTARTKFAEMDHYFATQIYTRRGSGSTTTTTTTTTPPTGPCTGIEGTWDVMFYTSPGKMDVARSGSGYTGHVYLVSWLGLETLKNITYDQQTGAVSFYRDSGNQTYTGTLSGNSMSGTFIDLGHPGYQWSATRTCASTETGTGSGTGSTTGTGTGSGTGSGANIGTGTGTGTGSTVGSGAALVAGSRIADPNSTVQVPILLNQASGIGSMNFVLSYNPQVLKVNKVDGGSMISGALFTPNFKSPPQIRFGLATSGGINGSGTVAYIEFQVIGAAGSSSPLTLSEVDTTNTSGSAVAVTTQNGTLTVASGAIGTAGGKTKGDYNGDGKVTELDALAALKMSVKLLTVDLTLDMDGNGKVTAEDARLILKQAVGK